jgi:PAS domain S-box-containing protein
MRDEPEPKDITLMDVGLASPEAQVRERFVMQLRTAAEIAEQVGSILDPDALLAAMIPLLKERFELYHAHVYLVEGENLVLRAGYGQIGKIMVQQGHRIARDHPHSLVAQAARTREPVLVNDVSESPDFLPNILLPQTRSEVAVPIVSGDQVLGVFDVQADEVGYFTVSDLDVFRTLSGLLSNALTNAMLFRQQVELQRELRGAVQTVRAVFDAMTEGIMVTDMMGRITDLNEAALTLFGHEAREELLGRSIMELVTRASWPRMSEATHQALASGRGSVEEYTMLRKDGSSFVAEQSSALLWNDQEDPQGVVSITRDVTERKRARREIARFQALADNAVDAILMVDFSGQITYANAACRGLFASDGSSTGILGRRITDLWPEADAVRLVTQVLPAAGAEGWQGEATQLRLDGVPFEAALTFFGISGEKDEPIGVAAIVRDITDRKRAEADLRRFALQLRTAADVSAQINAILDPTALLEAVVPLVQERFRVYHLHVYTLDAEAGRLVMRVGSGEAGRTMREQGHTIALDRYPSLVAQAARTKEIVLVENVTTAPSHMANPLLPKTRSEVAIPMLVGDELIGVFDVQDDAVARFSESEVDVLSALAAQIGIALRNAQSFEANQAATERLREVDRLKSEFLANMSHELRTPLNSILGYAEVMLMGIDGELTPDMEEDAQAIFENGQQLLRLINDILDLTKIEAGRMTLNRIAVAAPPLLDEVKSQCLGLLHKRPKPVTITVMAEPDLPLIYADPMRLSQILGNLVANATKFTEAGEIKLRARYDPDADLVCLEVSDTGVGMSEEDLTHLFERFRQVDGSSTRRAEGTGLGLAITKHLVELHAGELRVESALGHGSTFAACLPVAEELGADEQA